MKELNHYRPKYFDLGLRMLKMIIKTLGDLLDDKFLSMMDPSINPKDTSPNTSGKSQFSSSTHVPI